MNIIDMVHTSHRHITLEWFMTIGQNLMTIGTLAFWQDTYHCSTTQFHVTCCNNFLWHWRQHLDYMEYNWNHWNEYYRKCLLHDTWNWVVLHVQHVQCCDINRAWQINRINTTNRINNRLIDICKLGVGLIRINMDQ